MVDPHPTPDGKVPAAPAPPAADPPPALPAGCRLVPVREALDGYWAGKRLVVVRPSNPFSPSAVVRDQQGTVHRVNACWLERCWQRADQTAGSGREQDQTGVPPVSSAPPGSPRRCGRALTQRGRDLAVVASLAGFLVALGLLGVGITSRNPAPWGLALGLFLLLPFIGPWVEGRVVRRAWTNASSPAPADPARGAAAGPDRPVRSRRA